MENDVLQAALARAITDSISPEMQKEVFREAMTNYLFRANGDTRRGETSVVTDAFKRALDDATREIARAVVNDPVNHKRIAEAVQGGLEEALKDKALMTKMAEKIVSGLRY